MRRGTMLATALALAALLAGCGWLSIRTVKVTTANDSGERISNIEVDYAGGSYGISELQPGQTQTQTIRFRGASPLTYSYRDAAGNSHTFKEGAFEAGAAGAATVRIGAGGSVKFERSFAQ